MLARIVAELHYKDWRFNLVSGSTLNFGSTVELQVPVGYNIGSHYSTTFGQPSYLTITTREPDSDNPDRKIILKHTVSVPQYDWLDETWERWLFDRISDVERHERMENFWLGKERPFYPDHGPNAELYTVKRRRNAEAATGE